MSRRLIDLFEPGDEVEIHFSSGRSDRWLPGLVLQQSHPGLWVKTGDGNLWYVTNGRRIRKRTLGDESDSGNG